MAAPWFPFRSVIHLWKNAKTYYSLITHRDTPLALKAVSVLALLYLISPYDLVPDWLVGFGLVDDIAIVSLIIGFVINRLKKRNKDIDRPDEKQ